MKFLPLIWKNIWRRKIRTIFTLLSIFVAFLLFGILMTIRAAFSFGVDVAGRRSAGADPQGQPDHAAARCRIRRGCRRCRASSWRRTRPGSAASTRIRRISSRNIAVEPEPFLKMYPEFRVPPEQMKAWLADRQGAIVGRDLRGRGSAGRSAIAFPFRARSGSRKAGRDLGVQHRRHLRRRRRRRQDAVLLPLRLSRREPRRAARAWSAGTSSRSPIPSQAVGAEPHVRRDVRQLGGRDQDDDGEGIRRGLRQADRRHRRDHDRDPRRRAVHDPAGGRQHDGAVGARAHQRAGGAEDARLLATARS